MNAIETMIDEYSKEITVEECNLYHRTKRHGIYADGFILLDNKINYRTKKIVLMEEYLHHKYSTGNILDEQNMVNKKQENFVRRKNYEVMFNVKHIIEGYKRGFTYYYEFADHFELPEKFIKEAFDHYKSVHGLMWKVGKYVIFLGNGVDIYKKDLSKKIYD